ncbi:uncharacterized protein LOC110839260 isoform X3 [Zootermopsis nevadensis]|uniref:uncharacterized protein LOC110839260 isoform X3 n=1 Tax=Zootermopsis nevadensis TaxID=136037 RepID=UPI000B8EB623|nr:uncharacterized protein LOC110839260 isoform X3 [Zootermopsis nevadensis]
MAATDLLDYSNEQGLNVDCTPERQQGMGSLSGSGRSSVRKSGKLRKLFTPKELHSVDENTDISPEPCLKRKRLSSISHTATVANGSYIDSSFDVVDVTPGINGLQSLTFRSHLNNYSSVPVGNLKVTPESMQHCDSFNKNDSESLPLSPVSIKMYENGKKMEKVGRKGLFCRKGSKSSGVSGITSLSAAKTSHATSSKCSGSVIGNSLDTTGRVHRRQTEIIHHTKQNGLGNFSELIHKIPCRTEAIISPQKSPQCNEDEEELPPTQPIASLLLRGVVAYAEVRSGGDNRSMGIKAHLRSLGANVRDKFTNDVTHVVFNEGLLSTYKKAIKRKVHLVSVSWIEECKNAQTIVSERLYPPFDMAKYESPNLLKKFRKAKSLQPDFENVEEKIKKRRQKKFVSDIKENEPEIELLEEHTCKKQIKVPEFLQNVSNENGLVRTLLSVADIGPEYEKIVNRPVSPTLSEEEDFSIPLAVRLLRKILTPQPSPELTSSREGAADRLKMASSVDDMSISPGASNIQETPKRQCGQDLQRRNKVLPCSFMDGKDTDTADTGAEVGINNFNVTTQRNNLSQSLSESPALSRSGKVSLAKPVRNILLCSKDSGAKNDKCNMSSAKLHTTTGGVADSMIKSGKNEVRKGEKRKRSTMENIIVENSDYKSGNQCENHPVNTENLRAGMFSSVSMNKEDQFPDDMCGGATVSKITLRKKRKLLPLQQLNSPDMLDVSADTEETCVPSVQCPYTPEGKTTGRKKRKTLLVAGETSAMELTSCVPSTSTLKVLKCSRQIHKKFDSSSNEKHEFVSQVSLSYSRSCVDEFIRIPELPAVEKPHKILERKLPSLVCTGLHRHFIAVKWRLWHLWSRSWEALL